MRHQAHRADIGVEIHLAAHAEQDFLGVNVRRDARVAEGADENGVEIAGQSGEAIGRDGDFIGEVTVGSPVERGHFDRGANGPHDIHSLRDDFLPDPVAGDYGNSLLAHANRR